MKRLFFSLFALFTTTAFADDGAASAQQQNMYQTFLMIALAGVFFYFFIWRPEQKKRATLEKQRSEMKKGDRVMAAGLVGTVKTINDDDTITITSASSTLDVLKAAVIPLPATPTK